MLAAWFHSFITPRVVMAAIRFSLIGILPLDAALSALFSAISRISFVTGAGIVVRKSIPARRLHEGALARGHAHRASRGGGGAVRFRHVLLTALLIVAGAALILFDPIVRGLAISLTADRRRVPVRQPQGGTGPVRDRRETPSQSPGRPDRWRACADLTHIESPVGCFPTEIAAEPR